MIAHPQCAHCGATAAIALTHDLVAIGDDRAVAGFSQPGDPSRTTGRGTPAATHGNSDPPPDDSPHPSRGFMRHRTAASSRTNSAVSASSGTSTSSGPAPRSAIRLSAIWYQRSGKSPPSSRTPRGIS
jgi:hypothetical protein